MLLLMTLLLMLTYGYQSTFAEVDSRDVTPPLANPVENLKDMQKYVEARNLNDERLDSYVFAYNNGKEKPYTTIDPKTVKRVKRSPIELIKFELADAKEPDEMTKALLHEIRQQRLLEFETLKLKPKTDRKDPQQNSGMPLGRRSSDQSSSESKHIRVFAPDRMGVISPEKMPLEVRRAIESAVLQKRSLYNAQPSKRYAAALDSVKSLHGGYGELPYKLDNAFYNKAVNLDFANQIPYIPALFPGQHTQFLPKHAATKVNVPTHNTALQHNPHNQNDKNVPQLKFVHFAKPIFAPTPPELKEPATRQHAQAQADFQQELRHQQQPHNNVNINLPNGGKKIEINFEDEYIKHSIQEITHIPVNEKKFYITANTDEMTKVLKNLISKTPAEQLQGLSLLLSGKEDDLREQSAPEKNTAPILFPPVKSAEFKPKNNFVTITQVTEKPKDYTPITEQQLDDVTPAPNVQYIPVKVHFAPNPNFGREKPDRPAQSYQEVLPPVRPATSYQQVSPPVELATSYQEFSTNGLSPNYEGIEHYHDDEKELQYASKYNFGYRIRDIHTGNDFGHTEKRDNDGVTRGQYHILLPDGRIQNVEYHVDDTGYHADVTYESVH